MDDLLTRLEARRKLRQIPDSAGNLRNLPDPLCAEAAAEIRSLRARLDAETERCFAAVEQTAIVIGALPGSSIYSALKHVADAIRDGEKN